MNALLQNIRQGARMSSAKPLFTLVAVFTLALGIVVRRGMQLVAIGAVAALAGAWIVTRLMSSLWFGVAPRDPLTFGVLTALLVATALLACLRNH